MHHNFNPNLQCLIFSAPFTTFLPVYLLLTPTASFLPFLPLLNFTFILTPTPLLILPLPCRSLLSPLLAPPYPPHILSGNGCPSSVG